MVAEVVEEEWCGAVEVDVVEGEESFEAPGTDYRWCLPEGRGLAEVKSGVVGIGMIGGRVEVSGEGGRKAMKDTVDRNVGFIGG